MFKTHEQDIEVRKNFGKEKQKKLHKIICTQIIIKFSLQIKKKSTRSQTKIQQARKILCDVSNVQFIKNNQILEKNH